MGEDPGDHPGEDAARTATHRDISHNRDLRTASRDSANPDPSRRTDPREGTTTRTTQEDATSEDQPGRGLATEDEAEKLHPEDPHEGFKEGEERLKPRDELVHPCQQQIQLTNC